MSDRPILILYASAGGGHLSAARALAGEFARQAPGAPVHVIDVLAHTNPGFRALYAGGYHFLERRWPAWLGTIYDATDHLAQRGGWRAAFQHVNARPFLRELQRLQPRLILNTHFLAAELVAEQRRTGRLTCPQATVLTDFEVHRLWIQPPTERYYVACELARLHLLAGGVSPDRVVLSGIPLRPAFAAREPVADVRRRLSLPPRGPVLLLLCGGLPADLCRALLAELMTLGDDAQITAIAGRNRRAVRHLTRQAGADPRVRVLGYCDRMAEWMRCAALIVTKPGGLTSAEALAAGAPLLLVHPVPGQEARNSDFLLEHGAALRINHPRVLAARVRALLAEPQRLQSMSAAAAALGRPQARAQIVADVLRLPEDSRHAPAPTKPGPAAPPRGSARDI
jgi:processive 1,2-diacylglycerol beta-glucosyltransferase